MAKALPTKKVAAGKTNKECSLRFEAAAVEPLFTVLDAIAWLDVPDQKQISQFAGIDPRTTGKLLKNALTIGIVQPVDGQGYVLSLAYPFKGTKEQKTAVLREALVRMPLLASTRQFESLGDKLPDAVRKAATLVGVENFNYSAIAPLIKWASTLGALEPGLVAEDLVSRAVEDKENRHKQKGATVAFLSHSSKDKPFIRQLAADLTAQGITVWLDEHRIKVGDSIPGKIAQGLAESDYFILALSEHSVKSKWVEHELNNAMINEIAKRKVKILPIKLAEVEIPDVIADKKYADFSKSYREGLSELLDALGTPGGK